MYKYWGNDGIPGGGRCASKRTFAFVNPQRKLVVVVGLLVGAGWSWWWLVVLGGALWCLVVLVFLDVGSRDATGLGDLCPVPSAHWPGDGLEDWNGNWRLPVAPPPIGPTNLKFVISLIIYYY
jgi:hypothetical protein